MLVRLYIVTSRYPWGTASAIRGGWLKKDNFSGIEDQLIPLSLCS